MGLNQYKAWSEIDDRFETLAIGLGFIGKSAGKSKVCRCPDPYHEDAHASAQVNPQWANIYCYTCCKGWKAPDLIEIVLGVTDNQEKLKVAQQICGITSTDDAQVEEYRNFTPQKKVVETKPIVPNIQPVTDRDRNYTAIAIGKKLLPSDYENLKNRGMSDTQISWGKYFSVDKGDLLAGFGKSPAVGFTCPVRQYGQVVAIQIRNTQHGSKYIWVSENNSCHISVAENRSESPLSFLLGTETDRPMLSEGFLKTDIIYLKTGKTCIGASGGNWWAGQAQLLDYIQKYQPIGFDIFADAESLSNPSVAKRTIRQASELQKLGMEVRIADYGQLEGKDIPSPDDWLVAGGEMNQITWISLEEFESRCDFEPEKTCKEWILKKAQELLHKPGKNQKNNQKKFIRPLSSVDLYFPEGGRIAAIETAIASGKKLIADSSPTGTGKSYTMGELYQLKAEHFGVSRLLFITEDPRNITISGLEDVTRIDSRHRGITVNENGEHRIAKKGEKLVSPASCFAPEIFAALRTAGIENADSSAIGCVGCPYFNQCKSPASRYNTNQPNYLYQRKKGLGQTAIILHPQSLPQPKALSTDGQKFPYSKSEKGKDKGSFLYWEEFGKIPFSNRVSVKLNDIKETFYQLNFKPVDFFDLEIDSAVFFTPILRKLQEIMELDNSRFGISHQDIVVQFDIESLKGKFTSEQLKEIYDAIAPDLSFLKLSLGHDIDYSIKEAENLAKQWLHHFFGVLIGEKLGHFHVAHGELIIELFNDRISQIAAEAEINVFSDATLTRDRLAAILRVNPDEIFVICQESGIPKNLKIKQVPLRSYLHRGADQTRRIEAAKAEIISRHQGEAIAVIGSKKAGDSRYWFNHNRGSNFAYKERITHLILDGTPVQNIASLEAEYHLVYGAIATQEQLQQFTLEKIYIEFTQALGRPRANLRDDAITVWAITDLDLSPLGYPVEKIDLGSLSINCLSMVDRLKRKIGDAIKSGAESCQAIAEKIGCSQGRISQIAKEYGGFRRLRQILISLLGDLNKEINISAFDGQEDPEAMASLALEFLGIVTGADSFLGGLANAAKVYDQSGLQRAIAALKSLDIDYFESTLEYIWEELILSLEDFSICENL